MITSSIAMSWKQSVWELSVHINAQKEIEREIASGNRVKKKEKSNRKGSLVVRQNEERHHRVLVHLYQIHIDKRDAHTQTRGLK